MDIEKFNHWAEAVKTILIFLVLCMVAVIAFRKGDVSILVDVATGHSEEAIKRMADEKVKDAANFADIFRSAGDMAALAQRLDTSKCAADSSKANEQCTILNDVKTMAQGIQATAQYSESINKPVNPNAGNEIPAVSAPPVQVVTAKTDSSETPKGWIYLGIQRYQNGKAEWLPGYPSTVTSDSADPNNLVNAEVVVRQPTNVREADPSGLRDRCNYTDRKPATFFKTASVPIAALAVGARVRISKIDFTHHLGAPVGSECVIWALVGSPL